MVLENVTELYVALEILLKVTRADMPFSDYSGNHTKLKKILLNGNNICMASPLTQLYFNY
jgi:small nuclear ribonucleoprotein (snRNP)-like protein